MQNRRSRKILDKPFQFKMVFYLCGWVIVFNSAYPFLIKSIIEEFIHYVAMDPMGPDLSELLKQKKSILSSILFFEIILLVIPAVWSIYMSHRIVGPVYQLKKGLQSLLEKKYDQALVFRKTDYFQDMLKPFNDLRMHLFTQHQKQQEKLGNLLQVLDNLSLTDPVAKERLEIAKMDLKDVLDT